MIRLMDLVRLIWHALIGLFRSRALLEAEILALRQQLNALNRKSPERLIFSDIDRCSRRPLSFRAENFECVGDCEAGNRDRLAFRSVSVVLTVEITTSSRSCPLTLS